jgi:nitric oxide reductase large subunit
MCSRLVSCELWSSSACGGEGRGVCIVLGFCFRLCLLEVVSLLRLFFFRFSVAAFFSFWRELKLLGLVFLSLSCAGLFILFATIEQRVWQQ